MSLHCQPPVQQVVETATELPLAPGSDPLILDAYRWTLAHSPSLQQVVQQLVGADRKARYRLLPGLDPQYTFLITPTNQEYEIDVRVPVLGWRVCGDALEAWIASTLFLVLEVVKDEKYRAHGGKEPMTFLRGSIAASFAFQNRVKQELEKADPGRLKDLPDGARIYATQFVPDRWRSRKQRALPGGLPSDGPSKQSQPAGTSVAVVDRPITLPPMPRDGKQGHAQFKDIHGQIGNAMADLNRALPALYGRPEGREPLPVQLSIPPENMAEATALLEIIQGQTFLRLERAYLDTWKGWQAALVEGGTAQPLQGAARTPEPVSKAFLAAKERAQRVLREPSRRFGPGNRLDATLTRQEQEAGLASKLDAGYLGDLENPPTKGFNGTIYAPGGGDSWQSDELRFYIKAENAVVASLKEQAVAGELLSLLAETWTPLMDDLNASATRVLNQEGTPNSSQEAAMEAIRVHARLAVLERFRKALWYCDLVWCQVASETVPPPPQRFTSPAPPKQEAGAPG